MRCVKCGTEVPKDWQQDGVCVPCLEYQARMKARGRRGTPPLPRPSGWPEILINAIQKIRFWRD
jgi:hypothetical protein